MHDEYVTFKSRGLSLEGYMCVNAGRPAMVICHPHPLHGGSMDSSVVLALRDAAWRLGFSTLRFNFRGTGRSEGTHNNGVGEVDDAIGAFGFLRSQGVDIGSVCVAGYSFGAAIALRVSCLDERVNRVIAVAAPASYDYSYLSQSSVPKLFILGEFDDVAPPKRLRSMADLIPNSEIKVIGGADHFFKDELDIVRMHVEDFLRPKESKTLYKDYCGKG